MAVATDHLLQQQTVCLISSFVPKLCFRKVLNGENDIKLTDEDQHLSFESLLSYTPPPQYL